MSTEQSIYEEIIIESNDQKRTVDLRLGTASIDYYEDIFSPVITAKLRVVNGGDTIAAADNEGNPDGYKQSVYNGLPLRGAERVSIKIAGNSSTNLGLDFSTDISKYLYVSSISDIISDAQKESFTLHLVSREAFTNETSRVGKKYPVTATIDEAVNDILKNYLKTSKIGTVDKSSNKYGFLGNMRKPFTVLVWLASKAVPESSGDATAGFVFYQTQDGFQFRSLDSLISQDPKAEYTFTEVNQSSVEFEGTADLSSNDFKILSYMTEQNQNLIEKLRMGTYSSYRTFYNPLTFEFTDPQKGLFKLEDYAGKAKNLGKEITLPNISSDSDVDLGSVPTRFLTAVLDIGTMDKNVSQEENAEPEKYQSQAIMRYNLMFTQTLSMMIPLNTNLRAGDVISCKFPTITRSDREEFDKDQSGLYMIKELCHHFDASASYTSMKLIRDTFGRYGTNNK
jgi:hypothetical protein